MWYQPGNYVCPADLPRRILCCVASADTRHTRFERFQILGLVPLEGPWRPGTMLIRLSDAVVPAEPRELWRSAAHHVPEAEARSATG